MSLKRVFNNSNKVISQKLAIRYSVEPSEDLSYWIYTRYATLSYSFVGMDEETADNCAMAKVAQYMRDYAKLGKIAEGETVPPVVRVTECKSDIRVVKQDGSAWNVEINVNETDVKADSSPDLDPSGFFAEENGRDYDGGGVGDPLVITSIQNLSSPDPEKIRVRTDFVSDLGGFDIERVVLQYKVEEDDDWAQGSIYDRAGGGPFEVRAELPNDARIVRLVYGLFESNSVTLEAN